jgi:hypothetical protein
MKWIWVVPRNALKIVERKKEFKASIRNGILAVLSVQNNFTD